MIISFTFEFLFIFHLYCKFNLFLNFCVDFFSLLQIIIISKGYEYRESKDFCCGECVPVACVVDDVLKKPGENWTSSDKCTTYTCEQFGDQFSVSSQQESCPDLADCPVENIYTKGCCKYCNITTEAQSK